MNFQKLYLRNCNGVAFVEVEDSNGDINSGTAFHIGDNIYLTAKHVVEGRTIRSVQTLTRGYHKEGETQIECSEGKILSTKTYKQYERQTGHLVLGPFCDEHHDVAVFKVSGIDAPTFYLGLSSHEDYYLLDDDEMMLSKVLIMGYPRVAFADGPRLIATKAEISTIIEKVSPGPPFFIVSAMARGGFSGGPCIAKNGECLGLVTESLTCENQTTETGFMSVLTAKPIFDLLIQYNLVPEHLGELIDEIPIYNWRRPEDPPGMSWNSPDSVLRSGKYQRQNQSPDKNLV